jgi:hypothetical protein
LAVEAQKNRTSVSHTHSPQPRDIAFRNLTNLSSSKDDDSQAHQSVKPGNDWRSD